MWPTQGVQSEGPKWSERDRRARLVAIVGICVLVLLVIGASIASWLVTGQRSGPIYGNPRVTPGAVWTWDGTTYAMAPAAGPGPSSNRADMAYDRTLGVIVLWDHGCAALGMGFQGGCVAQVNQTWTWDGRNWTARAMRPAQTGNGWTHVEVRAWRGATSQLQWRPTRPATTSPAICWWSRFRPAPGRGTGARGRK